MWTVYIIECKDSKLYTGITNDLNRRLKEHNSGNGGRFTRFRKPVKLVYCQETIDKSGALRREIEIKKLSRSEKLELIRSFSCSHRVAASGQFLA
jgi:putative endonuclease